MHGDDVVPWSGRHLHEQPGEEWDTQAVEEVFSESQVEEHDLAVHRFIDSEQIPLKQYLLKSQLSPYR